MLYQNIGLYVLNIYVIISILSLRQHKFGEKSLYKCNYLLAGNGTGRTVTIKLGA